MESNTSQTEAQPLATQSSSTETQLGLFKQIRRAAQIAINTLLDDYDSSSTIVIKGILQEVIKNATTCLAEVSAIGNGNDSQKSESEPNQIVNLMQICLEEVKEFKQLMKASTSLIPSFQQIQDLKKIASKAADLSQFANLTEQLSIAQFDIIDAINQIKVQSTDPKWTTTQGVSDVARAEIPGTFQASAIPVISQSKTKSISYLELAKTSERLKNMVNKSCQVFIPEFKNISAEQEKIEDQINANFVEEDKFTVSLMKKAIQSNKKFTYNFNIEQTYAPTQIEASMDHHVTWVLSEKQITRLGSSFGSKHFSSGDLATSFKVIKGIQDTRALVLGANIGASEADQTYSIKYLDGPKNFEGVANFTYRESEFFSQSKYHFIEKLGKVSDPLKPEAEKTDYWVFSTGYNSIGLLEKAEGSKFKFVSDRIQGLELDPNEVITQFLPSCLEGHSLILTKVFRVQKKEIHDLGDEQPTATFDYCNLYLVKFTPSTAKFSNQNKVNLNSELGTSQLFTHMAINFCESNDIKDISKLYLVLASSKSGESSQKSAQTLTLFELGKYFSNTVQFNFIKSLKVASSEKMGEVSSFLWLENPNKGSETQLFSLILSPHQTGTDRSYALLFKVDSKEFSEVFNTRNIFKFRLTSCSSLGSSALSTLRNHEKKDDSLVKISYDWLNPKKIDTKSVAT